MKVYLVTDGEYSGFYVHSVHSTEAAATYFARRLRQGDVQEWSVDEITPADYPANVRPFQVMLEKDGSLSAFGLYQDDDDALSAMRGEITPCAWGGFIVCVLAKDRDHAIKAAQDRRAQWLAEQAGVA